MNKLILYIYKKYYIYMKWTSYFNYICYNVLKIDEQGELLY